MEAMDTSQVESDQSTLKETLLQILHGDNHIYQERTNSVGNKQVMSDQRF